MDRDELIANATKIIVAKANPKRIILFGSRARGEAKADSDVDLLIIVPDGKSSSELRSIIAIALMSADASFDVIVTRSLNITENSMKAGLFSMKSHGMAGSYMQLNDKSPG
jgi:predicted nucleotidyltransferase